MVVPSFYFKIGACLTMDIPLLTANDVELRVAQIQQTSNGVYAYLLLYKNARVDMRILDEVYGSLNWKRSHTEIGGKLFCTVSIWDEGKQMWIEKQDVGVPSNTEAAKGEASDSFKRACFNLGIGRELYSAPEIKVKLNDNEVFVGNNGKPKTYARFYVAEDMSYDKQSAQFTKLTVLDRDGNVRFDIKSSRKNNTAKAAVDAEKHNEIKDSSNVAGVHADGNVCCNCHAVIKSSKVLEYAMNKFGKAICYDCQKKMIA